jgi:hypothetical protein
MRICFCQYIGFDPANHDMWDEHPFALSREAAQWEMVQRRQGMPRYYPLPGTERERERLLGTILHNGGSGVCACACLYVYVEGNLVYRRILHTKM